MGEVPKSAHPVPRVSSQRVTELQNACLAHGINSLLAKVPQNVSRASAWIHFPIRTSDSFTGVHSFVCYVAFVAASYGAAKGALAPAAAHAAKNITTRRHTVAEQASRH